MTNTTHDSIPPLGISIGLSFLICLVVLFFFISKQKHVDEKSFEFSPLTINLDKLNASRLQKIEPSILVDKRAIELKKIVRLRNADQFLNSLSNEEIEKRRVELLFHANETLEVGYFNAFWTVGDAFFKTCKSAILLIQDELKKNTSPQDFKKDEKYIGYRESCGNILPFLIEKNLLTPKGDFSSENSLEIIDLLNRYRWAETLRERRPIWEQLSTYEHDIFEEWIVKNKNESQKTRMRYARSASEGSKDPHKKRWLAKLYYQEGNTAASLQALKTLQKSKPDPFTKKMIEFLQEKTSTKN